MDLRLPYIDALIYAILVVGISLVNLSLVFIFGPRRSSKQKFEPFECGVPSLDETRKKFYVRFYLVAALFILFDIEAVFLFPWAVVFDLFETSPLGVIGIIDMFIFLGVLGIGLFYILKRGAVEWD